MTKNQLKFLTIALILGNIMSGLDSTIINTAIPSIVANLHGIQFMGWIIAIFLLGMSISIPLWTKVAERIGNKNAFLVTLSFFIVGSILEAISQDMTFFLSVRIIMGIGAGGMGSLPYIIVGYIYPNIKQRTKALGILTSGFNAAAIVGSLIGGWIIDISSWHWIFYINIPIGLLAMLLTAIFYKKESISKFSKFDTVGSALLVTGLITFLLGIQLLGLVSVWLVICCLIISLLIMTYFFIHENKEENPVLSLSLFTNKNLIGDFLLFALTWGAFIAVNVYLPMWAQAFLGMTALIGGMTLIPNSCFSIVASQFVYVLQGRTKTYYIILVGIIGMLISSFSLLMADLSIPLWILIFTSAFSGMGVGFIFVELQVKVQVDAGREHMADATSTSYLIRILAQTVMAAIYGVIMNLSLNQGIKAHPQITLSMLNKMSDCRTASELPAKLLPLMRAISHSGIRVIMLVSCLLLVISLVINYKFNPRH